MLTLLVQNGKEKNARMSGFNTHIKKRGFLFLGFCVGLFFFFWWKLGLLEVLQKTAGFILREKRKGDLLYLCFGGFRGIKRASSVIP